MSTGHRPNVFWQRTGHSPFMPKPVEILVERLNSRISEMGLTDHAVSIRATGNGDAIREIKRGKMPGATKLSQIAAVLDTTSAWLLGDDASPREAIAAPTASAPVAQLTSVRSNTRPFDPRELPKDVPVYTGALGTAFDFSNGVPIEAQVMDLGEQVDTVRRPPALSGAKGIYALYIAGDSQSPRFEPGEMVFVHPHRPVAPGDDVVVQILSDEGEVVCALVKRLVRRTGAVLTLRQFNPSVQFDVPMERVRATHKILTNSDLWGF